MAMLKKAILALIIIVFFAVITLVAFLYLAPTKFTELAYAAGRHHAGLVRKEITLPDGLRIVYLEGGQGSPLLLLHGFGANKDNFVQIAPYLTDRYHLIIPDMVGFGESDKPLQIAYDPGTQADRLHALMQALGFKGKVAVGGNSMGGLITLHYGLRHAQDTASLWLLDPAGVFSAPETEYMRIALHAGKNPFEIRSADDLARILSRAFAKPPFIPRPIMEAQARDFIANKSVQDKVFADIMKADTEKAVAGMTLPTLIIWGDQDQFVHPAGAEILHKLLPASQVIIMHNMGHIPQMEAPAQTASDFINFQNKLTERVKAAP